MFGRVVDNPNPAGWRPLSRRLRCKTQLTAGAGLEFSSSSLFRGCEASTRAQARPRAPVACTGNDRGILRSCGQQHFVFGVAKTSYPLRMRFIDRESVRGRC